MKRGETVFNHIATGTPINRTAAVSVSARGSDWVPEARMPPGFRHWKSPPAMLAWAQAPRYPGEEDLTGKKFGRLTVLGILADSPAGGRRWVLRCVCGDYEARASKAIRLSLAGMNAASFNPVSTMCWYCAQWQITQNRHKKMGSKPVEAFVDHKAEEPRRSPNEILARRIGGHNAGQVADEAIKDLNRAGYRIIREKHGGNAE